MTLSEIIKTYMKDHRLSYRRFAEKCGVSHVTISFLAKNLNPQTGKQPMPTLRLLKQLAEGMDMTLDELLHTADDMPVSFKDEPTVEVIETKLYPISVFDSASAGFGAYAREDIVDTEYLPFTSEAEAKETLCIRVSGDSMLPKIEDGDLVQVHRQDSVDSGDLAVVRVDGTTGYIKIVEYNTSGEPDFIRLRSYNPYYPPILFEGPEVQRVAVVGKVKKILRTV